MKVFTALLAEISVKMLIYYQKKFQLKVNILLLFVLLRWKFSRVAYFLSANILPYPNGYASVSVDVFACYYNKK